MSAQARGRAKRFEGAQRRARDRARKRYVPPTLVDVTTCEVLVWDRPTVATQGQLTSHRCGAPTTHLGLVTGQPKPTFPLCGPHADQWPNEVVKITLDTTGA